MTHFIINIALLCYYSLIMYCKELMLFKDKKSLFSGVDERMICSICNDIMIDVCQSSCGCRFCRTCISSPCPNCHETNISFMTDKAILREISNLTVKCCNIECMESMQFRVMNSHLLSCKFRKEMVKCPLAEYGCLDIIEKSTVNEHMGEGIHQKLLLNTIKQMKIQHENEISKLNIQIREHEIRSEFEQNNRWIISNIRELIRNARDGGIEYLISPERYNRGYKMALKIFFNGNGVGRYKYLSVYFIICKGDYDDENIWPFSKNLKISLIGNNVPDLLYRLKPDKNEEIYKKPVNHYNLPAGQPQFIPIKNILQSDSFVHDGSLILELDIFDE